MGKLIVSRFVRGFLILLPVILSYLLFGALFDMIVNLTIPITDVLPDGFFPDAVTQRLIALAILVVLCLAAGFVAEVGLARRLGTFIEDRVLRPFAPYGILKRFAVRLSGQDVPDNLEPVFFLQDETSRMLAFVVEHHEDESLTLYVPFGAMPGVGQIHVVRPERVERVDASMMDALGCLFNWGEGAEALMKNRRPA